ncbi:MAG TPA: hypothetical protein VHC18_28390 [Amycolatopsis sp.]|nr:hypothetical protein [Amycolatopsis sp.]
MKPTRGLRLDSPDEMTDAEVAEFRASYERTHGSVLDAYDFWLDHNPRVVKSHRIQAYYTASDEGRGIPLHGTLGFLHLYTVLGYDFGIEYEVKHARSLGATKTAVLQTIELAFIHCGPRGAHRARLAVGDLLKEWTDDGHDMAASFPAGWSADPDFLALDLDLTTGTLSPEENHRIRDWYLRTAGEVPRHVDILAAGRPGLLKAYLDRLGRAMRGTLPRQMFPFAQLQFEVARANPAGIRESALLGRGLGMTDDQLYEAMAWGMLYGGPSALSQAADVLADVLPPRRSPR